ncbi:hypothetical protein [Brachybacterium massiliense]|uniref:hypothetical protein n=1 Tax=Brachybacterium massiliense TaxID=1755098 RepID=UPI000B3BCEEB|nr:hypothetical protein [Brachybacterium massiliense]
MKRTLRLLAAPAAALLLLAACGGTPDAEEVTPTDADGATAEQPDAPSAESTDAEEPEGDAIADGGESDAAEFDGESIALDVDAVANNAVPTRGSFYLEGMTGVKGIAEIGVEGPEDIERMRELVGEDPVTYIRIDVDNRDGTEEIGMYEWLMYDADGNEYAFQNLNNQAVEWDEIIDDGSDLDLEVNDLAWEIESESANVGQRNEQWLVGPGDLPDEVSFMSASTSLFADEFVPFPVK